MAKRMAKLSETWVGERTLPLPVGGDNHTLGEARATLRNTALKGASCPCCGQLVKVYKRKLHSEMAVFLCRLVRRAGMEYKWVNVRHVLRGGEETQKASTDGAYLTRWRLVETKRAKPGEPGAGLYRPTELGVRFVMRKIRVPSHIYMFNNTLIGFTDKLVTIDDALGDKFSYEELMREEDA